MKKINKSETWKHYNLAQINRRLANMSLMTTPKHPTSLYQNKRNLERSPYFAMKNLPLGGCQSNESPLSFLFFSILLQRKNPFFLLSLFLSLPKLPYLFFPPDDLLAIRASNSQNFSPSSNACCHRKRISPLILFLFSPIYITPQDLNLFPKRKILPFSLFFSPYPFLNLPIQKQSS